MSTLRVNTVTDSAGSGNPDVGIDTSGIAKAWVNFNGVGTVAIRAAFNVSSITDNGTGNHTVNFTNAMTDSKYATVCSSANSGSTWPRLIAAGTSSNTTYSVSAVGVYVVRPDTRVAEDNNLIQVTVFR